MARDRFLDAALGAMPIPMGMYPDLSYIFKFGFGAAIPSASEATIWGENDLYSYPASAEAMTVSSSDANDTSAGTGAQTVRIDSLEDGYIYNQSDFSLNGQTGVAIGTRIRTNRIQVLTAGSGGENAGTIYVGSGTVTAGVPANIYATIEPSRNQTLMCLWTVPVGRKAYLKRVSASTGGNANTNVTIRVVMRPEGGVFNTKDIVVISPGGGLLLYDHYAPIPIAEKTDIELRAQASTGTTDVSATFEAVTTAI